MRRDNPPIDLDHPPMLSVPPMRYPNEYIWLVFVSSMDLCLTWLLLTGLDADEINPLADIVLSQYGHGGLIAFKFALVLFVVLVCEQLGRERDHAGRLLARFGVGVSAIPMIVAFYWLLTEVFVFGLNGP